MRVSDLYANEALHVQNEKSKAAMLNRPDSYLNDAIDLRVILTETPVFSSAPWSSGTRLLTAFQIKQLSYPYIMLKIAISNFTGNRKTNYHKTEK